MRADLPSFGAATKRTVATVLVACLGLALAVPRPARADPPPDRIADVVARVRGAVVRIICVQPPGTPPPGGQAAAKGTDPNPLTTIGSGFIIDSSGLVVTNRHVVENAVSVFVGTPGGGRYRAELIITAAETDIALLRISPGKGLPTLTFGDSDALHPGDAVIAIGDPFGFGGSVSAGIVSATNRNIMESPFDDYIQTDAAINHGNSGGPLFNLAGQVVGMTSVLFAPGGYSGSAGVGFALPSNLVSFVLSRLEERKPPAVGRLPVRTQQVPGLMAAAIGAPEPGGALVVALTANADTMAGAIQPGDIIETFDGTAVLDPRDLARKAARAAVGSRVKLGLYRLGQATTAEVPILLLAAAQPTTKQSDTPRTLGLHLVAGPGATPKPGVIVEAVDPSGSVADSGLRKGDVIVRIQQQPVATPEQALTALQARAASKHHYAAVLVERDKNLGWMPVGLPENATLD